MSLVETIKDELAVDELRFQTVEELKTKASDLWQELNEADISYDEYVEVSEHIVNLFATIK